MEKIVSLLQQMLRCLRDDRIRSPWLRIPDAAAYVHQDYKDFKRLVDSGKVESHSRGPHSTFVHVDALDELMRSYPSGAKVPEVMRVA